jgi:hypothetical protein
MHSSPINSASDDCSSFAISSDLELSSTTFSGIDGGTGEKGWNSFSD